VDDISFKVSAGEILGIAGVQGNGQTELVRCLTGLMKAQLGKITILGTETTNRDPRTITELGVAHIPEDRQKDLNTYYQEPFAKGIILQPEKIHQNAEKLIKYFDIRTPSSMVPVSGLSGGNQQKVIVAREFSRPIKLLIASQPTRGLDVGSIEYIHRRLIEKRDDGCAILLVSTELDEVMQLADRIAVMYRGKILAIVDAEIVTKEELGLLMAGIETEIDTERRKPRRVHEIVT